MSEPALKLVPELKTETAHAGLLARLRGKRLRLLLLVVIPLIAAAAGLTLYLSGGRYISTDNAYVGAQKVLITPDISGKIARTLVREGQHVNPGDELFVLDPEPFRLAVSQAESRVATVKAEFASVKTNLESLDRLVALGKQSVELKQRDVERKSTLLQTRAGSQADVDAATVALVAAQNQLAQLQKQQADLRNQLLDNPNLPIEQYPAYMQAAAALDQARRDLAHTTLRAPIAGTATQVDNIQLGRYVTAGTPVMSVIDDGAPWVDANPKETDITYLRPGQPVTIEVDTFPNRSFRGVVAAVSPGTGAQFSILPPQNASGNWVKVVQRVPVRIRFDQDEDTSLLRAGMSATVSIDTGHRRTVGRRRRATRRRTARAAHDLRDDRDDHAGARHHDRQRRAAVHARQPVRLA
jgi:membrane fusion protein (multidrug efflux system)